jgi:hypothetical protein
MTLLGSVALASILANPLEGRTEQSLLRNARLLVPGSDRPERLGRNRALPALINGLAAIRFRGLHQWSRRYSSAGLKGNVVVNVFIDSYVDIVFRAVNAGSSWLPRLMDSQSQTRKIISALDRDLGAHATPFRRIHFKRCRSTLLKPADRLASH